MFLNPGVSSSGGCSTRCEGSCDGESQREDEGISAHSLHTQSVEEQDLFEAQSFDQGLDLSTD